MNNAKSPSFFSTIKYSEVDIRKLEEETGSHITPIAVKDALRKIRNFQTAFTKAKTEKQKGKIRVNFWRDDDNKNAAQIFLLAQACRK